MYKGVKEQRRTGQKNNLDGITQRKSCPSPMLRPGDPPHGPGQCAITRHSETLINRIFPHGAGKLFYTDSMLPAAGRASVIQGDFDTSDHSHLQCCVIWKSHCGRSPGFGGLFFGMK
jgi:hypothetical protein